MSDVIDLVSDIIENCKATFRPTWIPTLLNRAKFLRADNARLTAELDAAKARIAELENTQTVILGMENPEIDLFLGDDQ